VGIGLKTYTDGHFVKNLGAIPTVNDTYRSVLPTHISIGIGSIILFSSIIIVLLKQIFLIIFFYTPQYFLPTSTVIIKNNKRKLQVY
jgi:hypothetical protein